MSYPATSPNSPMVSSLPGEPAHYNRPITPDLTRPNRILNVEKILKTMRGRNQVPYRLRSHIKAARNPLTQRPAPSRPRSLPAVNLTQQHHLRSPLSSNHTHRGATAARSHQWRRPLHPYPNRIARV
jgi:hypothetical protein